MLVAFYKTLQKLNADFLVIWTELYWIDLEVNFIQEETKYKHLKDTNKEYV